MRKIFVAVSMLLMSFGSPLSAHNIDDSNAVFKDVVQLFNTNADKDKLYEVAYKCYATTLAVLDNAPSGSNTYNQAT